MSELVGPMMATHQPDWSDGRCLTCLRPWPCLTQQVLLEAHFLDARGELWAHLEAVCQEAGPAYRRQILGWLSE